MRLEDKSALSLAQSGQLGEIRFFRYFLSIGNLNSTKIPNAVFVGYQFAEKFGKLQEIYATFSKDEKVTLLTGKSKDGYIVNLFFDFTNQTNKPIKQVEIAGSQGIYQFDTTTENAFQSNFLTTDEEFFYTDASVQEQAFFNQLKENATTNELICVKGAKA